MYSSITSSVTRVASVNLGPPFTILCPIPFISDRSFIAPVSGFVKYSITVSNAFVWSGNSTSFLTFGPFPFLYSINGLFIPAPPILSHLPDANTLSFPYLLIDILKMNFRSLLLIFSLYISLLYSIVGRHRVFPYIHNYSFIQNKSKLVYCAFSEARKPEACMCTLRILLFLRKCARCWFSFVLALLGLDTSNSHNPYNVFCFTASW